MQWVPLPGTSPYGAGIISPGLQEPPAMALPFPTPATSITERNKVTSDSSLLCSSLGWQDLKGGWCTEQVVARVPWPLLSLTSNVLMLDPVPPIVLSVSWSLQTPRYLGALMSKTGTARAGNKVSGQVTFPLNRCSISSLVDLFFLPPESTEYPNHPQGPFYLGTLTQPPYPVFPKRVYTCLFS